MKDPVFLSSPVFPPKIPSKPSLSTTRDDRLISLLSQDFTFKAQLTSLYMHPTDYTSRLYDKNQDFFTSIASKIISAYQYDNTCPQELSNISKSPNSRKTYVTSFIVN